ncbi:hypothetical protein L1987_10925 [Smallanthus sonchifolius]|uniref:Uncharacterized protein n=1 Tax=Smallanthus sonchifolius TaxID=185202 RepID=A0ACB9JBL9_9ASTR|nr:hypothetical protein L1987_10925 [Smallanthus sonchifolius]
MWGLPASTYKHPKKTLIPFSSLVLKFSTVLLHLRLSPHRRHAFSSISEFKIHSLPTFNYLQLPIDLLGFHGDLLDSEYKTLYRLTKSKEAALLDAGSAVHVALAEASMVEEPRVDEATEICQEEDKIMDKNLRVAYDSFLKKYVDLG